MTSCRVDRRRARASLGLPTPLALTVPILFLVSLVLLLPAAPAAAEAPAWGHVKQELDTFFQELTEDGVFNGSVWVARDGKVLLAKGYGLADADEGIPNRRDTVFAVASFTKAFTAASVLLLQERGRLSLDDSVALYVPELAEADRLTIRHLLSHTSGLFDYLGNPLLWENFDRYHTPDKLLEYFRDEPLRFEPGTAFEYSNSNYITAGVIVERVSGMAFEDFLRLEILDPLGLDRTVYAPEGADLPRMAVGYDDLAADPPVEALVIHPSIPYTAGGMVSTVEDLYLWDQALYGEAVLSRESLEAMFTPGLGSYGLGWYIDEMEVAGTPHRHIWHWGSYFGFHGYFSRLPEERVTIILQLNLSPRTDRPDELRPLAEAVAEIVLGEG